MQAQKALQAQGVNGSGSVQNDSATYSNSQSFNNSVDNINPNSLSGNAIDEKRVKKRQRKQEKTRKVQSRLIYKQSETDPAHSNPMQQPL